MAVPAFTSVAAAAGSSCRRHTLPGLAFRPSCRDLKPENFLLASKADNAPIKCTDFGLSVFFKPGQKFREVVGSGGRARRGGSLVRGTCSFSGTRGLHPEVPQAGGEGECRHLGELRQGMCCGRHVLRQPALTYSPHIVHPPRSRVPPPAYYVAPEVLKQNYSVEADIW